MALTIFALIAASAYTALRQGLQTQEQLQAERDFWRRLDSGFSQLAGDLAQARELVPRRPGRLPVPAFRLAPAPRLETKGTLLRFTRGGHTSFQEGPVSPYLRVAYRLREGALVRAQWVRLDRPATSDPQTTVLLREVVRARVRAYGLRQESWRSQWPPRGLEGGSAGLPAAVEVTLEVEDRGQFRRIFRVGPPR